jgi:hypothetical protein
MPILTFLRRSIVGAGLGGTLASPAISYPGFFQPNSIFSRFPYLLPNIVCTCVVVLGLIVGFLFLEESHEDKKDRRDVGLEIGKWIIRNLSWQKREMLSSKVGYFEETLSYMVEDEKSGFSPSASSPLLEPTPCSTSCSLCSPLQKLEAPPVKKISLRQGFTRQVALIIVSYGILAL